MPTMVETGETSPTIETWRLTRGALTLPVGRGRIMAVLNVTPDSFSDGGRFLRDGVVEVGAVVDAARELVQEGAELLDVGGESTRPGADSVGMDEELRRVIPVLEALSNAGLAVVLSVDTRRAEVARRAVEAGAHVINDVSGLADPDMANVAAQTGAGLVIGHLRGEPSTMQRDVRFDDLLDEVGSELQQSVERALAGGVDPSRIVVDPGVGFGKSPGHSAALVVSANALRARLGRPVLVGASRKRFLGALTGRPVGERVVGSVAAAVMAVEYGASIVRVHDVAATVEGLAVARGVRAAFEAVRARGVGGEQGAP